jgi:hypothetical protein
MDNLDELLRAPLPEVADDGFTAGVVRLIEAKRERQAAWGAAGILLCALVLAFFVPWQVLIGASLRDVALLLMQPGVYIAAIALSLTMVFDRQSMPL